MAAGVLDGYPGIVRGGTFFAALPLVTKEGKTFGANFSIIPSIKDLDGAVVVQFKVKAF